MVDVDNGRRLACMSTSALVDYALLVASSACFARVKSRSSLCPDSLSHQRERWADARPPLRDSDPGHKWTASAAGSGWMRPGAVPRS